MSRRNFPVAAAALLAAASFLALPAAAQDGPADNRYSMQPVDGGVVRMDNVTGEMSLCRVEDKKMVCDMATDRQSALQDRIDRLAERVDRLEGRMTDRRAETKTLPGDKDLDRAMNAFERVMRRLFRMVDDLNRDFGKDPGPEQKSAAGPEKT